MLRILAAASVAAVLAATSASALTMLTYDTVRTPTLSPNVAGPGVTGLDFTQGAGLSPAGSGPNFGSSSWDPDNASSADAIADDDIWTWGFTSAAGYDLTDFSIRLDRSGSGPSDFVIDLSVNGGAFVAVLTDTVSNLGQNYLNVDLSSFDNVTSATFRLAAFNANNINGRLDLKSFEGVANNGVGFALTGEIAAVPLPAGLPLLAAALGGLGLVARRRKS